MVGGELEIDGVRLGTLARAQATPFFAYSSSSIDQAYAQAAAALAKFERPLIAYAMKANSNVAILRKLAAAGAGADTVSGGEISLALHAGFAPTDIVMSGVGKTDDELRLAVSRGIGSIHVESGEELEVVAQIAASEKQSARVSFRVNPDVDPATHPYISTGLATGKFGIPFSVARQMAARAKALPSVKLVGLTCHIGSLLRTVAPLRDAARMTAEFAMECRAGGAPIDSIDFGGGWPIAYGDESAPLPDAQDFGSAIADAVRDAGVDTTRTQIVVELGRFLVGNAGALVTTVLFTKEQGGRRFAIVDAAMTELLRPALYGAFHQVVPARAIEGDPVPTDIVGPVCESADFLAKARMLAPVKRGDVLVVLGAGAYASAMSSNYNARPRAAELLCENGQTRVVRARESVEDLLRAHGASASP